MKLLEATLIATELVNKLSPLRYCTFNWKTYGTDAIKLLESFKKDYYIKEDLKEKMK